MSYTLSGYDRWLEPSEPRELGLCDVCHDVDAVVEIDADEKVYCEWCVPASCEGCRRVVRFEVLQIVDDVLLCNECKARDEQRQCGVNGFGIGEFK